ncbi:MAG TPA: YoaK family protein, partial [Bryobacteraceae bacterium]|nr:YoaK family protein [Bryobacteraceae bacterium]
MPGLAADCRNSYIPANWRADCAFHNMASRPGPPSQVWLAILMAACAGFVDVACFFRLAGIFGSFMTGNSSHFAYNLSHRGSDPARYGWALASYALGLLFSASLEQ